VEYFHATKTSYFAVSQVPLLKMARTHTDRNEMVYDPRGELGMALVGTLMVVIILGVMVSIALSINPQASPNSGVNGSISGTTTTIPKSIASGANEAAVSACEVNFQAITTALNDYRAVNASSPPPGHLWATSSAKGGPFIQEWPPYSLYYNIVWNGVELSVIPGKGPASRGSVGTASPATGCFAA
jgi:hypothetical protein